MYRTHCKKSNKGNALMPFGFENLDHFISEVFNNFGSGLVSAGEFLCCDASAVLPVDLKEGAKEYTLTADLPGVEPETLNVTVHNGVLTIQAEKSETSGSDENDPEGFIRRERSYGAVSRTLQLPQDIDEGKVKADYKKGILTVSLPKKEGAGGRKIDVRQS